MGAAPIVRPLLFSIWVSISINFPLNRKILSPSGFFHNFFRTKFKILLRRPLCAHCLFFILPPINFFEKSWARAHRAPMSFFISAHDPRIPTGLAYLNPNKYNLASLQSHEVISPSFEQTKCI